MKGGGSRVPHTYSEKWLQNHSKNVSLKIGTTTPQKLSQIFKNGEKLHYKIIIINYLIIIIIVILII